MSENIYSMENYSVYGQAQYPKPQLNENQLYFTYSPGLTTFSPNSNYINNVCTNTSTQNVIRNPNSCSNYQDQVDMQNWDNRIFPELEKVIKFPDKMDTFEISSKDLSPASYCSNVDLLVPELFKTANKDTSLCNKYESQSYYAQNNITQRNYDYLSCVQYEKSVKYSSKTYDEPSFKSCSYNTDNVFIESESNSKNIGHKAASYDTYNDYNLYNYYDRVQENALPIQSDLFSSTNIHFDGIINNIDQQTEDSNEDSDIVVEDSDDELVSCEDQDKGDQYSKCLICNVTYKPFGIQFYFLTSKSPLTMSSQMPVIYKIVELVGQISTTKNYLCSECLGLLNTMDHLQIKIDTFNAEFIAKYKKACVDNNIEYTHTNKKKMPKTKENIRYKCKYCKKVLSLKNFLSFHLKKHKNPGLLCEYCGDMCKSKKKFVFHKKKHFKKINLKKIDPFKCKNCVKIFRTKSNLKCHENYCLGIFPYGCKHDKCDKKFATATQLKNHTKLKHDKKFVAICSICNIGFVKMSDYKNHKIIHSTDKKYSCTKCDKSYKSLCNLRFHMKLHNKELPFVCPICKKGFMRKEYFEAHVNNHNGIKKYECSMCKKKFPSQKNLDSHLKSHENSKRLPCNICGKMLPTAIKLKDHIRVHNNLKEYECDQCDLKFNIKDSLRKHVKKRHKLIE